MSATPDGKKLGFSVYARPTTKDAWKVYGTTFAPGKKAVLTLLDPVAVTDPGTAEAPGDFLMSTFDNRARMTVTWTRSVISAAAASRTLFRDIYSATSK